MLRDRVPCSFAYKLVCVDDQFTKPIVVFKGKNATYEFIKIIFKEFKYSKKVMKKRFNKNMTMSEEEEARIRKVSEIVHVRAADAGGCQPEPDPAFLDRAGHVRLGDFNRAGGAQNGLHISHGQNPTA